MRATTKLLPLAMLAAIPALSPARAADDPLAGYRWQRRVVVALAPTAADPLLSAQRRLFAGLGAAGRERDLALVAATDDTPGGAALRRRFGGEGFVAVLVGKDGGEKLRSASPLGRDALFPLIDAMPMRRDEMARRP
ncbi:DUF4174 domain-containing protein [Lichenibacterium dinghuense]|uniref:DUF4174 domain-containing protein n=1 Tax=Lichenibacterium dinghuense TaxID=2895977 RepID=UPI001F478957|nr:DUF4174 domain-containing protein [Lichenibacterium sp. 6Y81]